MSERWEAKKGELSASGIEARPPRGGGGRREERRPGLIDPYTGDYFWIFEVSWR